MMRKAVLSLVVVSFLLPLTATAATHVDEANTTALSNGLVAYWPLDGNTTNWGTGGESTNDMSGNGNTGFIVDLSTTTSPVLGVIGQALQFPGNSASLIYGSNSGDVMSTSNAPFTLSLWVKPLALSCPSDCSILNNETYLTNGFRFAVVPVVGVNAFQLWTSESGGTLNLDSTTVPAVNTWYLVTVTYNGTAGTMYVNGIAQSTNVGTYIGTTNGMIIGGEIGGHGGLNGDMDDIRVYNRALSAQEVSLLYALGSFKLGNTPAINSSFSIAQGGINAGLVGYWPLDGNTTNWATGITKDMSGNGNNGQLVSMSTSTSPVAGKIGQALKFDGSASDITLPSSLATNDFNGQPFTVSAWVYPTASKQDDGILNSNLALANNNDLHIALRFGVPYFGFYGDDLTGGSVPLNTWSFVTFTYAGGIGARQIFVNGQLVTNDTSTAALNTAGGVVTMGLSYQAGTQMQGNIDDMRVYNRVLSTQEIAQLYAAGAGVNIAHSNTTIVSSGTGLNSGLTGYWTFDGPAINWTTGIANDMSGNGNIGYMSGLSTSTSPTIGKIGQAITFNGTSSYIYLTPAAFGSYPTSGNTPTYSLSFSTWFKTSSDGTMLGQTNACTPPNTCGGFVPALYVDTSGFVRASIFWHNSTSLQIVSSSSYADGKWHLVTDTYNNGVESLYIDGNFIGSQSDQEYGYNGSYAYLLGTGYAAGWPSANSGWFYFNGSLDDTRVYSRALSAQEVAQLYAAGR